VKVPSGPRYAYGTGLAEGSGSESVRDSAITSPSLDGRA
jgi:hypothetical protein